MWAQLLCAVVEKAFRRSFQPVLHDFLCRSSDSGRPEMSWGGETGGDDGAPDCGGGFICCTANHARTPFPVHARCANSLVWKIASILYTISTWHQAMIPCFSTSRSFWPAGVRGVTDRQRTSCRVAARLGRSLCRRRHTEAGPSRHDVWLKCKWRL